MRILLSRLCHPYAFIPVLSDEYYSGADYATPEDSYAQPYSNGTEGYR